MLKQVVAKVSWIKYEIVWILKIIKSLQREGAGSTDIFAEVCARAGHRWGGAGAQDLASGVTTTQVSEKSPPEKTLSLSLALFSNAAFSIYFPFPLRRAEKIKSGGGKHGAERVANRTRDIKRLWKERVQLVRLASCSPGEARRRGVAHTPRAKSRKQFGWGIRACFLSWPSSQPRGKRERSSDAELNGAWRDYATRRAGVHSGCITIKVESSTAIADYLHGSHRFAACAQSV